MLVRLPGSCKDLEHVCCVLAAGVHADRTALVLKLAQAPAQGQCTRRMYAHRQTVLIEP